MYSTQLVILWIKTVSTAEKVGINQFNRPNIESFSCLFLINQSSHISAALKVQTLWDTASADEELSAVNVPI